jgi:hypothetical protein
MTILVVFAVLTAASGLDLNLNITEELKPETDDKIPAFAKTFVGCTCTWKEPRGYWACEGTIAFPEEVQGEECGCCGLKCLKSNRKSDEQCLAGGFDQKAEMAAERKRIAELLKGADLLIGDELPGFIVTLPDDGKACTNAGIEKACKLGNGKESDLTPLCDHSSYASTNKCYTPGKSPSNPRFYSRHFSHWNGHRQKMNLDVDDEIFYGMCFHANNGQNTLTATGASHLWTNNPSSSIQPRPGLSKPKKAVTIAAMNAGNGELGRWRTMCVKNSPNR